MQELTDLLIKLADKKKVDFKKLKLNNKLRKLDILDLEITKYLVNFESEIILKK